MKKSNREDGRGHWPAGKHRNPDAGNWSRIRLSLQALLDNHFGRLNRINVKAVADDLGVSDRSVRRWLSGVDRPSPESQALLATWIKEAKKRCK